MPKISQLPVATYPLTGAEIVPLDQGGVTKYATVVDISQAISVYGAPFQEVITATTGQTVFTLSSYYLPGTNTLDVFIDGVKQYVGTSYTETNSTTVTFTNGLHVGALVQFISTSTVSTATTDSNVVTYQPAGGLIRTVQSKLRESVSVKDFGAVGDGVTNDTLTIQAAINSGARKVIFPQGTYYTDTLVLVSNQTIDLTAGVTLYLIPHTTTKNPIFRIGTAGVPVSNVTILGGKLDGNKTAQTFPAEEYSPGVMLWGSSYNNILGTEITNCQGDGVTIGFDYPVVVGSNNNTIKDCYIYNNARNGIAITYGNENKIVNNKIKGNIDLELDAGVGECKNNLVDGNGGVDQTENITKPKISSLTIYLASPNTGISSYYGNIVTNNQCGYIGLQYNTATIVANNVVVGSNNAQVRLMDIAGCPETIISNNLLIANTVLATAITEVIRTRGCSRLSVTNNIVENDSVYFHSYGGSTFGAETAAANSHHFYGNTLNGTGAYRNGGALNPSEWARFTINNTNGGSLTLSQIAGVPLTYGSPVRSGNDCILSGIGNGGTTYIINVLPHCNKTTVSTTAFPDQASAVYSVSGSSRQITAYTYTPAAGAVSLTQFSFAAAGNTGTFVVDAWY